MEEESNCIIYTRNCPNCNKILTTKNVFYYKKAVLKNSMCVMCSLTGRKISESNKEKLKKAHADFSGKNNPFYGKSHSEETKRKISEKKKGQCHFTQEAIEKMRLDRKGEKNSFYGKKHSEETKAKLSYPKPKEVKIKLALINKGKPSGFKGRSHSPEARKKMRLSAIKRLYSKGAFLPNINPKETEFFNKKEKELNLDGVYFGKNGNKQQYLIEELGYFVDFYDNVKNVVIEYDETGHYKKDWTLRDKDVKRQEEIKSHLKCKFYRYNESLDVFYET